MVRSNGCRAVWVPHKNISVIIPIFFHKISPPETCGKISWLSCYWTWNLCRTSIRSGRSESCSSGQEVTEWTSHNHTCGLRKKDIFESQVPNLETSDPIEFSTAGKRIGNDQERSRRQMANPSPTNVGLIIRGIQIVQLRPPDIWLKGVTSLYQTSCKLLNMKSCSLLFVDSHLLVNHTLQSWFLNVAAHLQRSQAQATPSHCVLCYFLNPSSEPAGRYVGI